MPRFPPLDIGFPNPKSNSGGLLGTQVINVLGDTRAYNYNANSWTERNPQKAPPPDDTTGMAYDAKADLIIFFGGFFAGPDTWTYDFDSDTWALTDSGMEPSLRAAPGLAYDTESNRTVLFGGSIGAGISVSGNDETWAHRLVPPPPDLFLVYIAIGVGAAAAVAVVAVYLTRRRRRMRKGEEGE